MSVEALEDLVVGQQLEIDREFELSAYCGDAADYICAVNWARVPGVDGYADGWQDCLKGSSVVGGDGDGFARMRGTDSAVK